MKYHAPLCRIMYVIRHWRKWGQFYVARVIRDSASVASFSSNMVIESAHIGKYPRKVGGQSVQNTRISTVGEKNVFCEESKTNDSVGRTILMDVVEGFCLKCKTYGPIKDGQLIKMKNGRTRMGGVCSQPGCTGKISKIVS